MGSIASRSSDSSKMGNTCTKPSSSNSTYNPTTTTNSASASGNGGGEFGRFKSMSSISRFNSQREVASVSIDHNDIRMRAESELSSLHSSPNSSFCVKAGDNVNCHKNGQVVSIVLLPHQHTFFCERKVSR